MLYSALKGRFFRTFRKSSCQNTEWFLRLKPVQMPLGKSQGCHGVKNPDTQTDKPSQLGSWHSTQEAPFGGNSKPLESVI